MRTATLMLTGLAAVGAGIAGGLATHPVPKIPTEVDWRQRYRAVTRAEPAPIIDEASYAGSWPYGLPGVAMARLYAQAQPALDLPAVDLPAVDLDVPPPPLERALPQDPWQPDLRTDRQARLADDDAQRAEDQDTAGRMAVAAALAQTGRIGSGPGDQQEGDAAQDPYAVDPGHGPDLLNGAGALRPWYRPLRRWGRC